VSAPRELSDSLRAVARAADWLLSGELRYATIALSDDDVVTFSRGYRERSTAGRLATRLTSSATRGFVAVRSEGGIAVFSGGWHVLGVESV
jgi:hypothetical protein